MLTKILRGYRGGPNFKNSQQAHYYLNGEFKLTLAIPACKDARLL
ncbi:hypothetical protein [Pseudoalteromonas sp. Z9A5]|nr:hypothetical protein [Pseudoalteromonas sp. Z9A5]